MQQIRLTCLIVALFCQELVCAQSVILDQEFVDSSIDTNVWDVFEPRARSITAGDGQLRIQSAGSEVAGLMTKSDQFPFFERPTDDSEYDVYFLGVRLGHRQQTAALGLYSTNAEQPLEGHHFKSPPSGFHDQQHVSYSFRIGLNNEAPGKHWVSTMLPGNAGAATDSTGADGFHTWENGKIYDFRIQVTKHNTTWWGREHPSKDWMPLQDPALDIGYDGTETGGRNRFGIFASSTNSEISIDRIYVTHYVPMTTATLLDDSFDADGLDSTIWSIAVPEPNNDFVTVADGRLVVNNSSEGSRWSRATGVWTRTDQFPQFERPTEPSERIYIDFLDVALPSKSQRCAMGLCSTLPNKPSELKFPDDHGPSGGTAYFFWVLPDNDRLIENSNQLRAGAINEKYAATDNYHHAWIWPYTERRDLRLEVTASDVRWYIRKHAESAWRVLRDADEFFYRRPSVRSDRNTGYWRPVYDPGVMTNTVFNGNELHGRSKFGVFVHVSSAGSDGPVSWQDGNVSVGRICVTFVNHNETRK